MRVLLDTTFARRAPLSGTAVYISQISAALAALDGVEVVQSANARRRAPAGGGTGSVRNLLADAWWTTRELPRRARIAGVDVIHHPLPAFAHGTGLPQVVTVQDLSFERLPGHFDRRFRMFARRSHRAAARAADVVLCPSETTAADLLTLWNVPRERIVVAPYGAGQELGQMPEPPAAESPPYFLYVGDDEPRKNLVTLLAAYRLYRDAVANPLELVLAGSANVSGDGVRIEPQPSAQRLVALYRRATALIHPSLYEGFGLTPLEAMSLGTPVLAARSPGVAEVCADAARYVEPRDPGAFAAAMADIAQKPALRAELAERGRRRALQFSWAASARAHLDAYSLALERHRK